MDKAFWILVCFNLALVFLIFSFVFRRDNIKTDLNQMNDNLNETSIHYTECLDNGSFRIRKEFFKTLNTLTYVLSCWCTKRYLQKWADGPSF